MYPIYLIISIFLLFSSIIWLLSLLFYLDFSVRFHLIETPDHLRPSDRLTRSSPLVTRYRWVTPPNRGVPWVLGPSSRFHHHIILLFHEDCHFASLDLWFSPYYTRIFIPPFWLFCITTSHRFKCFGSTCVCFLEYIIYIDIISYNLPEFTGLVPRHPFSVPSQTHSPGGSSSFQASRRQRHPFHSSPDGPLDSTVFIAAAEVVVVAGV